MGASRSSAAQPSTNGNERLGAAVELRYVARAGLLPELSRQTYDSLYKALREAVLNAIDADATRIELDFSRVDVARELVVADDGVGMTTPEFCDHFMSLGGSVKFGETSRFGRIGIGSLALLQYGEAAVVETKYAGSDIVTRATIQHPWTMARHERRAQLGDLSAGVAEEVPYEGSPCDHFTRVRLLNVKDEVASAGLDTTAFYSLLDNLRRVLPLSWTSDARLAAQLEAVDPVLVSLLRDHLSEWSVPIVAHAPWERDIPVTRRYYGDDQAGTEEWSGPLFPVIKTLRVPGSTPRRKITVAGYLLTQKRASAPWAGITARVQNVAVEEQTFFDVTSDPGFRKYISGEVWILGELDRERLINIDRSSFNRECIDYQVVQRYMSRAILDFKAAGVQRPQRQKVEIRRRLEQHVATLHSVQRLARLIGESNGKGGLPSSEPSRGRLRDRRTIVDVLEQLGARVNVRADSAEHTRMTYVLDVANDGKGIVATVSADLVHPEIEVADVTYQVGFAEGDAGDAPVLIRNRPREIIFNMNHPVHTGRDAHNRYQLSLALEMSYLLSECGDPADLYERMLGFMEGL
jgi:hypothetical protein